MQKPHVFIRRHIKRQRIVYCKMTPSCIIMTASLATKWHQVCVFLSLPTLILLAFYSENFLRRIAIYKPKAKKNLPLPINII